MDSNVDSSNQKLNDNNDSANAQSEELDIKSENEETDKTKIKEIYNPRAHYNQKYRLPEKIKELGVDISHLAVQQAAYDLSVYLHKKVLKLPKYEKFGLGKDITSAIDELIDELELYEVTHYISHLYNADRCKRRLFIKLRLAHDLRYSCMNIKAFQFCSGCVNTVGRLLGSLIVTLKGKESSTTGKKSSSSKKTNTKIISDDTNGE